MMVQLFVLHALFIVIPVVKILPEQDIQIVA
jgi:hypothetical protein